MAMRIILVTGPIASGKSLFAQRASQWFNAHNRPVKIIELDIYGHEALQNQSVIRCLVSSFGKEIMHGEKVDKAALASCAFRTPENVEKLNLCTHGFIGERASHDTDIFLSENSQGIVILETPFPVSYLKMHGFEKLCEGSFVVAVSAPKEIRLKRCFRRYADAEMRDALQQKYGVYTGDYCINNESNELDFNRYVDTICQSIGDQL